MSSLRNCNSIKRSNNFEIEFGFASGEAVPHEKLNERRQSTSTISEFENEKDSNQKTGTKLAQHWILGNPISNGNLYIFLIPKISIFINFSLKFICCS